MFDNKFHMRNIIILVFMYTSSFSEAQDYFNTDNIEIVVSNDVTRMKTKFHMESDFVNLKDSIYSVSAEEHRFINGKKVISKDSIKINKSKVLPIQNILLNIDNTFFNSKRVQCLDGLSISIKFYDKSIYNSVEQRFSCVSRSDEIYKSILKIYSYFPFKKIEDE